MDLICKKCDSLFKIETDRDSICVNCKTQLDLLENELKINEERIKKLEKHKKSELENPKSQNHELYLETIKRLEHNLEFEYKKRDGIIKTINSKDSF